MWLLKQRGLPREFGIQMGQYHSLDDLVWSEAILARKHLLTDALSGNVILAPISILLLTPCQQI